MSNAYAGWSYMGTGSVITSLPATVNTSRDLFEVRVPAPCHLESVEVQVASISSAASLKLAIFRDAAGDEPVVGDGPTGATQTLTTGTTTGADGGSIWLVEKDVNALAVGSVTGAPTFPTAVNLEQSLWVGLLTDAGSVSVTRLIVNWRS